MRFFHFLYCLAFSCLCYAGSSDALITGVTSSGRTELEVKVGDVTGLIRSVRLSVDGESYLFSPQESTVIKDDDHGVYVLIADGEEYQFKMWMVPGSEKTIFKSPSSLKTRFAAVIEATDPRKGGKWVTTPRITIGCELHYAL